MFVVGSLLSLNARKIVALFIDTSVVANSETVRLALYALGAAGWIALIGNLLLIAAKTPVR